ncbi:hypothetical protein [Methanolobus chelungpuianus]|uniref:Uncharacterized protein n=1 Tax=Methanolobus chelungpuianus TaxID=502115 RepID=A0AAE3KXW9_9EURY|nr:hypothetical protein [Methanolobus chelungpuianus]MCQ6962419.1 hypothetical protein [Methanolobus chelungpuianus]
MLCLHLRGDTLKTVLDVVREPGVTGQDYPPGSDWIKAQYTGTSVNSWMMRLSTLKKTGAHTGIIRGET